MNQAVAETLKLNAQAVEVTAPDGRAVRLTHAEVAALNDYDAVALGLPRLMDALVVVTIDGRIDQPDFAVRYSLEPFGQMHPWAVHHRAGSLVFVGDRIWRLNARQLQLFELLERLAAAADDVAARLVLWPELEAVLHADRRSHILVTGDVPHLRIYPVVHLPVRAMTRVGTQLVPAIDIPHAGWAMDAGRRYYLRTV